jgi:hypothetical protein
MIAAMKDLRTASTSNGRTGALEHALCAWLWSVRHVLVSAAPDVLSWYGTGEKRKKCEAMK